MLPIYYIPKDIVIHQLPAQKATSASVDCHSTLEAYHEKYSYFALET